MQHQTTGTLIKNMLLKPFKFDYFPEITMWIQYNKVVLCCLVYNVYSNILYGLYIASVSFLILFTL